jgi:ParB/RepB/Spo0J family partition protein
MLSEAAQPRQTDEQEALFEAVKPTEKLIKIADILPYRSDTEINPRTNLGKSIASFGVDHSSITVLKTKDRYEVFNGRRRLDAYKAAGVTTIRAKVYPEGTSRTYLAGVALASHLSRKSNPLDEAKQIASLATEGLSLADISDMLGVPIHTLKRLNALNLLPEHITEAIRAGKMTLSGALTYTKLDKRSQKTIDEQLQRGEKVLAKEVKEQRKALHSLAFEAALFEIPTFEQPSPQSLFRNALNQALNVGLTPEDIRTLVEEVLHGDPS